MTSEVVPFAIVSGFWVGLLKIALNVTSFRDFPMNMTWKTFTVRLDYWHGAQDTVILQITIARVDQNAYTMKYAGVVSWPTEPSRRQLPNFTGPTGPMSHQGELPTAPPYHPPIQRTTINAARQRFRCESIENVCR